LNWDDALRTDPDLAAHITVLRQRGLALRGPPIAEVFPVVPAADYVASILADVTEAAGQIDIHPTYAVLNLCRVLQYLLDGAISSKDEAGVWAAGFLPARVRRVVSAALAAYRDGEAEPNLSAAVLASFAHELLVKIHKKHAARADRAAGLIPSLPKAAP
ncbi:MAG: DUF4111 domain-containing protein, partial [Dehalococcoidia bacterium]